MEYHFLTYCMLFLPATILIYQLVPRKFRFLVLLTADVVFFYIISKWLIIFWLVAAFAAFITGKLISDTAERSGLKGKALTKKKRYILACGIVVTLGMLVVFKYLRVFGINLVAPIGISYYTLQTISYMTDIYRGTLKPDHNLIKVFLYLGFFPQIMEGPISRYSETADDLFAGEPISYQNLTFGYQRILWGLFKKMLIADRLAPLVQVVFNNYDRYDGAALLVGVVCYTLQLYTEFSGCMDIILGSGEVFGIRLPENFRQPFFASNAGDFWRRWHITLGTWLKDYIFYPISLAKPVKNIAKKVKGKFGIGVSKFVAPCVALFFVWLSNGIWHGAGWTYLFYGMYYFVLIFFETITEEPLRKLAEKLNINREKLIWRLLTGIKMFIIINVGELFFRAPTLSQGFDMIKRIVTEFHLSRLAETNFVITNFDKLFAACALVIIFIVDVLNEKGISIRGKVKNWRLPLRWTFWYAAIFMIIIFGAYGAGYTVVDMIYATY